MVDKVLRLKIFLEFQCRRVRGVAGAGGIVFLDQLAVHNHLILHRKVLLNSVDDDYKQQVFVANS